MTLQRHSGIFGNRLDHPPLKAGPEDDAPAFTKSALAAFVLVVGVFVAVRLWRITTYSIWSDEVFSLEAARRGWGGLIYMVVDDIVNPPLFYLLFKLWIGVGGESLLWLKLFPVVTSIATVVPFFLLCRELKLRAGAINLALMLMAVNGYLIFYAQEIRMYSLLVLVALCSLWLFVRFYNAADGSRKPLLALFVANLLLVYTHYYGWAMIGVEGVFLLFWRRQKLLPFSVSVAVLIVCFSPWAYAVVRAAMTAGIRTKTENVESPHWSALIGYYAMLNGFFPRWGTRVASLLFACPVLLWAWHIFKRPRAENDNRADIFWWLALFAFLPVVVAYVLSQVFPRFFVLRYLIIAAVPYMMLVAVAVFRLRPAWLRITTALLMAGYATLAGVWALNNEPYRLKLEALVRQMIEAEPPQAGDVMVYTDQRGMHGAMEFYLREAREKRFRVQRVDDLDVVDGDHFWVLIRDRVAMKPDAQKEWRDRGYRVGEGFESDDKAFLFPVWRQ